MLQATWPAIVALSLAALGVYSADTGIDVALGLNAVILFLWGLALARLEGASIPVALVAGSFTCALGLVLVFLKALMHRRRETATDSLDDEQVAPASPGDVTRFLLELGSHDRAARERPARTRSWR